MYTIREKMSQGYHAVELGYEALDIIGAAAETDSQHDKSAPAVVTVDYIFGNSDELLEEAASVGPSVDELMENLDHQPMVV